MGMWTQTMVKVCLFIAFQMNQNEQRGYHCVFFFLLLISALSQIKGLSVIMSIFQIKLIIPLYQSLIILLPTIAGNYGSLSFSVFFFLIVM